jgi:hypothetical protein
MLPRQALATKEQAVKQAVNAIPRFGINVRIGAAACPATVFCGYE